MKHPHQFFVNWMNRPLARVQVYCYRVATNAFGLALTLRFSCVPGANHRDNVTQAQRNAVAYIVRQHRSLGLVKLLGLPEYEMKTGNYSIPSEQTETKN